MASYYSDMTVSYSKTGGILPPQRSAIDKGIEGVMSGIISDPAFNNMYTATKGDNTMQATVTAVYEVGELLLT